MAVGWFATRWMNEFVLEEWYPTGAAITNLPAPGPFIIDDDTHVQLIGNDASIFNPTVNGIKGINYSEGRDQKIGNNVNYSTALVAKIRIR